MIFSQFLNSFPELYLSFCSESLDCNHILIYICGLWLLLLFFCFVGEIPSIFWENEHTKEHQSGTKKRKKDGSQKDWRYYTKDEEEKMMLLSILKSPLGQQHDSTYFRQLLCPDLSCDVCNNATTEMDQLLFSLVLEDAASSVSPLASTAPVTEPFFIESPPFSEVPPRDLIPLPLPESFPQPPSNFSLNPGTPLDGFPSSSPLVHSMLPEAFLSLKYKFPVDHSLPQSLDLPSLSPHDRQSVETPLTLNTIFLDSSITQDSNPLPDLTQTLNPTGSVSYKQVPPTLSVSPPPDCTLTVTQPNSVYISSPDSTGALSTHVLQNTDQLRLSASDFSHQKVHEKDSLPSIFSSDREVGYDSKKELDSYMLSLSGQSVNQKQLENALKVHLSKKLEEINENRVPATVHISWHAIKRFL